jgi:hypothetical protein
VQHYRLARLAPTTVAHVIANTPFDAIDRAASPFCASRADISARHRHLADNNSARHRQHAVRRHRTGSIADPRVRADNNSARHRQRAIRRHRTGSIIV